MTSETYSPSLNSVRQGLGGEAQKSAPPKAINDRKEGLEEINLAADQFALIARCFQAMAPLNPLIEIMNGSITSSMATIRCAVTPPARTFSNAITLFPAGVLEGLVASSIAAMGGSRASVSVDAPVADVPQVEHRGWRGYIDPAEYEARLEAISPRPVNNEAEEHVPPPPRGRGRAIRMR